MKRFFEEILQSILMKMLIFSGTKLFKYLDVYCPGDHENVVAMTFSNDKDYLDKVIDGK